jgi:hypothetical protein
MDSQEVPVWVLMEVCYANQHYANLPLFSHGSHANHVRTRIKIP